MSNFRPIAMRCTQEQFEEIKPKLKDVNIHKVDFYNFICNSYLTNNLNGRNYVLSNLSEHYKRDFNREVYEEWNEIIFLEACGIEIETPKEKEQRLLKELEEVRKEMEENEPKKGDICKFWDDDKSKIIVGKLECVGEIEIYPYCVLDIGFKNCKKITDENFLNTFDNL